MNEEENKIYFFIFISKKYNFDSLIRERTHLFCWRCHFNKADLSSQQVFHPIVNVCCSNELNPSGGLVSLNDIFLLLCLHVEKNTCKLATW